jgi:hypothetical protein
MLRAGRLLPPKGLSTLRFDAGGFPSDVGSLLPGLLAVTRTGLAPAGGHELVRGLLSSSITSSLHRGAHVAGHEQIRIRSNSAR